MLKTKEEQSQMTPEQLKEYKKELNRMRVQKYRDANRSTDEYKLKHKEQTYKYRKEHPEIIKELNKKHSKTHNEKVKKEKQQNNKTAAIIKIQNAIRNKNAIDKVATLYVDKQKQIQQQMLKANEVVSQINQEKKDKEILKNKINASVIANDMLNDLFPQILNTIPLKRNVGRPRGSKNKPKN